MTEADKKQFASIMLGLAANYGKPLDKIALQFYFRMLTPFEIDAVDRAAMQIAATRKYTSMPSVAEFIELLTGGSVEDQAEVEAGKVLDAIGRFGGWQTVVFDDPITTAVIIQAYGGWIKLCEDCGSEESEKWFRHGFAKAWAAYKRQGVVRYGALPGREEISITAGGFASAHPLPPARLVGDPGKARAVLAEGKRIHSIAAAPEMRQLCAGTRDSMRALPAAG